jgi:Tat protein secretion system quality control protein TatD with DNase activity
VDLVNKTAIVGEIGLDTGSRVPPDLQLENFRQILDILTDALRFVCIHSYRATNPILKE